MRLDPPRRALACPASLKGVLSASKAAAALAKGFAQAGIECDQLPVADGGEGTGDILEHALADTEVLLVSLERVTDAFGRPREAQIRTPREGLAIVEAAEVIPLDPDQRDPMVASSQGLGELIGCVEECEELLVCLGGTATVDGGAGMRHVLDRLPCQTTVLCDALVPLRDAAATFGPQKGATPRQVRILEKRLAGMAELQPFAHLPGAGAAGGLGAAFAALGATLVPGADYVLDTIGFPDRLTKAALVVTGEGIVDSTTTEGKAPGEVYRRALAAGARCAIFGGRVEVELEGAELYALSGRPERAREDLVALGHRLGRELLE